MASLELRRVLRYSWGTGVALLKVVVLLKEVHIFIQSSIGTSRVRPEVKCEITWGSWELK